MSFGGILPANLRQSRIKRVAYNEAVDYDLGLREDSLLKIDPVKITESRQRDIADRYKVTLTAPLLQTTLPYLYNFYVLSKAYRPYYLQNAAGENFIFNENTSTLPAANNSRCLALNFDFKITDKKRSASATLETELYYPELQWLYGALGTASPTAGSGFGPVYGLTAMAYDHTKYVRSNIVDVLIGGVSVGMFNTPEFGFKTHGVMDQLGRELAQMFSVAGKVNIIQTAAQELLAGIAAGEIDNTLTFKDANGCSFICNTGAASIIPSSQFGDKANTYTTLEVKGDVPFNIDDSASPQPNVVWASNSVTFNFL